MSCDSVVGTATGYGLDERVQSSSPYKVNNFQFATASRRVLEPTELPT
jgi:hypothetical protein